LSILVLAVVSGTALGAGGDLDEVRDIGSRRELFVDPYLVARLEGARLELQQPRPGGVAVVYDRPYEGVFAFYTTIIRDGDKFHMYYRGEAPGRLQTPI